MKKFVKIIVAFAFILTVLIVHSVTVNEDSILDEPIIVRDKSKDYLNYVCDVDVYADEDIVTYFEDYQWNVIHSKKVLEDGYVNINTGEFEKDEAYVLVPFIMVSDGACYVGNSTKEMYIAYYDYNKQFIGGDILSTTKGDLLEILPNSSYISIGVPREDFEEVWMSLGDDSNKQFIVVDKNQGKYKTISSAVRDIEDNGIILVLSGTYNECVNAWGKTVNIIGTDREECVLISYSSNYHSPPLKISSGTVSNMSIFARKSDGEGTKLKAYAIHVEDHDLADKTLVFDNCDISSDYNSGIGMGLRGGCEVIISNCNVSGKEYGIFCHDSAYSNYTGEQNLVISHTVIEGKTKESAMLFDSQGLSGTTVNVTFEEVTLVNKNTSTDTNLLEVRNNGGRGSEENWMKLKNYYLMPESKGNSYSDLNY